MAMGCRFGSSVSPSSSSSALTATVISSLSSTSITGSPSIFITEYAPSHAIPWSRYIGPQAKFNALGTQTQATRFPSARKSDALNCRIPELVLRAKETIAQLVSMRRVSSQSNVYLLTGPMSLQRHCQHCNGRMILTEMEPSQRSGYDVRTLECELCYYSEKLMVHRESLAGVERPYRLLLG